MTPSELAILRDKVARARLARERHEAILDRGERGPRADYWKQHYWKNRERILARRAERRAA